MDAAHAMIATYADQMALATTVEDVERAWAQGRVAGLMGAEGGHQIDESLGTLRMLHRLGVRYLTLTHNDNNPWADSATDEPVHHGLSDFGREVVAEMNRIGMLVDLSHVSPETMSDALDATTEAGDLLPLLGPRAVRPPAQRARRRAGPARRERRDLHGHLRALLPAAGGGATTIADVVAHVEHVRDVAGVEHVGLGGDYDGVDRLPGGPRGRHRLPTAAAGPRRPWLVRRRARRADLPQRAAHHARRRARRRRRREAGRE